MTDLPVAFEIRLDALGFSLPTPARVFEGLRSDPSYREFVEWCGSHYRPRPARIVLDVPDVWRYPPRLCSTPRCSVPVPKPSRPGRRVAGYVCSGCGRYKSL